MMCDAFDKLFDIILVKSISRFSRNSVDLLERVNELRLLEIEVIFEQEHIATQENEQDLQIAVRTTIAQVESLSISKASTWGVRRRFE